MAREIWVLEDGEEHEPVMSAKQRHRLPKVYGKQQRHVVYVPKDELDKLQQLVNDLSAKLAAK